MSMLVPDFWAEGRAQSRTRERQITVRRFGWSTTSQDDAQRMANERAQQPRSRAVNGERLPRRDPKVPYNGTHRTFSSDEPAVADFFAAVQADPVYVAMCRNQRRFRARWTAKPWRVGMHDRIVPRDAVWHVSPDRMAEREAWLAACDARAQSFAACLFEKALDQPLQSLEVAAVVDLHDRVAQALKPGLPMA